MHARNEFGAAAVEFAIIAPLFFMITFGMITGAIAFNQKNQLTHAAREGARYGATLSLGTVFTGCTGSQGSCWAQGIAAVAEDRSFGDLNTSDPDHGICVALVEGPSPGTVVSTNGNYVHRINLSGGSARCFDDNGADEGQRVQVLVQRPGLINAVLFQMTPTLRSEALSKLEAQ